MEPKTRPLRYFKAGDVIVRQGEIGLSAYIIEEGEVEVVIEGPDGATEWISNRGPGSMIGEMSIVDQTPHVASAKALKDCKMLEITQSDFSKLLKTADPLIQLVTQVMVARFRDTLARAKILDGQLTAPPTDTLARLHVVQNDAVAAIRLATDFKQALANDDVALHYQPIIDLASGEIAGFESLMRWRHKEKGYMSPGEFIPIVEKSDLIIEASRWVLRESCEALKRIEQSSSFVPGIGSSPLYISINISGADLAFEGSTDNLFQTLSEAGTGAEQVHFEITEGLLMEQPLHAEKVFRTCHDAGMGIAIDDFGTGYSSLSYLHNFCIDTLKIDQSFIHAVAREQSSVELIKSIVSLGKSMSKNVIVEGVESLEKMKILQSVGCDMAQGYYFAKPMSETDAAKLLQNWEPRTVTS